MKNARGLNRCPLWWNIEHTFWKIHFFLFFKWNTKIYTEHTRQQIIDDVDTKTSFKIYHYFFCDHSTIQKPLGFYNELLRIISWKWTLWMKNVLHKFYFRTGRSDECTLCAGHNAKSAHSKMMQDKVWWTRQEGQKYGSLKHSWFGRSQKVQIQIIMSPQFNIIINTWAFQVILQFLKLSSWHKDELSILNKQ